MHEWQLARTYTSSVVERVRRVGHPPLTAPDKALRRREPPPFPRPRVERRGGVVGAAGVDVAFCRGEQRQEEESHQEQKPLAGHLILTYGHGAG
jgi:hypothetical protein